MKNKIKKNILYFTKEIIPVIIGILIALYINNWNESRKERKYINQIFSSISKELKDTNEEIDRIIPLQKSLVDTISFYSKNKDINLFDALRKTNGIHIPTVRLNSWKAISNSKIELVNYDKLTLLSMIEEQQELVKNKSKYLMEFLYSNIHSYENEKKEVLQILIMDLIQTEESTREGIKNFEKLEKQ